MGGGFDGVAEGVAEVEDHAEAGLFLVGGDDIGFDADAGGDDVGEGFLMLLKSLRITGEDGCGVGLHVGEEMGVADDAGLDGLL